MSLKTAKANVVPLRQRTQYSCMAASLSMCLGAQGMDMDEDTVNEVMGAKPMRGASWEQAIAAAQHFGMRATLVSPCPLSQLKEWTDRGVAVMIAWNPEGRDWSHASVVFDVTETGIYVADPNIPDPDETVRIVPRGEFLKKWFEKWPDYLVRRPALAIEREITPDGRQIRASSKRDESSARRVARSFLRTGFRTFSEKDLRPFSQEDQRRFPTAEGFPDGSPIIAEGKLERPWRIKGGLYNFVTFLADASGVSVDFTSPQDAKVSVKDRKPIGSVTEAERFLRSAIRYFDVQDSLPPSFRWL